MSARKACFPPVVDARTRVLVLGSLPGDRSLAAACYYAHPQNQFWRLIGAVIGQDLVGLDYAARLAALGAAGIGLWDVVAAADRTGSGDAAIRDVVANDIVGLAATLPALAAIAFNGGASARIGRRALGHGVPTVARLALPSSSPLHTISVEAKLADWSALRSFL